MQVLLSIILFSALLATGACLECEFCEAAGTTCTGETKVCDSGKHTCIVALIENTLDGKKEVSMRKDCDSLNICTSSTMQFAVGNDMTYRAGIVCCIGDECREAAPELPAKEPQPNGKTCPACHVEGGVCGNETVACTGLDKYCFEVTSVFYNEEEETEIILKGCTTQSVCEAMKTGRSPMVQADLVKEFKCTPKISGGFRPSSLLLPPFSGLLMVKILL